MQGIELRSRPVPLTRAARAELERLASQVGFTWPALPPPKISEWFDDLFLLVDDDTPRLHGPFDQDPLRGRLGTNVLTRAARTRLRQLDNAGVPFRRLGVGYELDPGGPVLPLLPELRAGPHTCTGELAQVLVGPAPVHRWAAAMIAMLDWAVSGGGRAASTPHRPAGSSVSRIVFGVIAPTPVEDGQHCLWYQLTDGRW